MLQTLLPSCKLTASRTTELGELLQKSVDVNNSPWWKPFETHSAVFMSTTLRDVHTIFSIHMRGDRLDFVLNTLSNEHLATLGGMSLVGFDDFQKEFNNHFQYAQQIMNIDLAGADLNLHACPTPVQQDNVAAILIFCNLRDALLNVHALLMQRIEHLKRFWESDVHTKIVRQVYALADVWKVAHPIASDDATVANTLNGVRTMLAQRMGDMKRSLDDSNNSDPTKPVRSSLQCAELVYAIYEDAMTVCERLQKRLDRSIALGKSFLDCLQSKSTEHTVVHIDLTSVNRMLAQLQTEATVVQMARDMFRQHVVSALRTAKPETYYDVMRQSGWFNDKTLKRWSEVTRCAESSLLSSMNIVHGATTTIDTNNWLYNPSRDQAIQQYHHVEQRHETTNNDTLMTESPSVMTADAFFKHVNAHLDKVRVRRALWAMLHVPLHIWLQPTYDSFMDRCLTLNPPTQPQLDELNNNNNSLQVSMLKSYGVRQLQGLREIERNKVAPDTYWHNTMRNAVSSMIAQPRAELFDLIQMIDHLEQLIDLKHSVNVMFGVCRPIQSAWSKHSEAWADSVTIALIVPHEAYGAVLIQYVVVDNCCGSPRLYPDRRLLDPFGFVHRNKFVNLHSARALVVHLLSKCRPPTDARDVNSRHLWFMPFIPIDCDIQKWNDANQIELLSQQKSLTEIDSFANTVAMFGAWSGSSTPVDSSQFSFQHKVAQMIMDWFRLVGVSNSNNTTVVSYAQENCALSLFPQMDTLGAHLCTLVQELLTRKSSWPLATHLWQPITVPEISVLLHSQDFVRSKTFQCFGTAHNICQVNESHLERETHDRPPLAYREVDRAIVASDQRRTAIAQLGLLLKTRYVDPVKLSRVKVVITRFKSFDWETLQFLASHAASFTTLRASLLKQYGDLSGQSLTDLLTSPEDRKWVDKYVKIARTIRDKTIKTDTEYHAFVVYEQV